MSDDINPPDLRPAIAVSPVDQSPDRTQSDADQVVTVGMLQAASDRAADAHPAIAVSPTDQSSDRNQSDADQKITVGMLADLTTSSDSLIQSNLQLAAAPVTATEREATARKRFRWSMLALGVATLLALAGIFVLLVSAQHSRNQLADCIQPTGRCFQEGQARTGKAVGSINQITVLAAACAPDYVRMPLPARQKAIEACILARLPKGTK